MQPIMCEKDFDDVFHVRVADRCCANCEYGRNEYEGGASCLHPRRNDGGHDYEKGQVASKWRSYNTMQNFVCDLWSRKEGETSESC